ncbi:MAG: LuxR C-terminal-related transcriptional regulator [Kiloniellales bacterium]
MRVLLIGPDRSPAVLAEEQLLSLANVSVERTPRLSGGLLGKLRDDPGDYDVAVVWHELLETLDRVSLRDYAALSRRMPIIALMSLGDWTGGRPGVVVADGWVFLEVDLGELPVIVRLAEAGYWTAPDSLVGPQRHDLRRRQALRALNIDQLKVLSQLAGGYTNREIARHLHLSEPAVKKTVHDIIARLGLSNRTQVAVMALSVHLANDSSRPIGNGLPV